MTEFQPNIIYVDCREKEHQHIAERLQPTERQIEIAQLPAGDILFNSLLIERKTASDFLNSIFDRRIWDQAIGLTQASRPIIIVIGDIYTELVYHEKPQALLYSTLGALGALASKFGIAVLPVKDEHQFIYLVKSMISRYDQQGEKPIMFSKKQRSIGEIRLDMLTALDGISYNKAEKILSHFGGSLRAVVLSDEKQLQQISGIGKALSKSIIEVFK